MSTIFIEVLWKQINKVISKIVCIDLYNLHKIIEINNGNTEKEK